MRETSHAGLFERLRNLVQFVGFVRSVREMCDVERLLKRKQVDEG